MRSSRTPPKETKVCPVCDATIEADADTCPSCLTDLTLFDLGESPAPESRDVPATEGKSIDDILASIMDGKADQPEIFETLKTVAKDHDSTRDLVVGAQPAAESSSETRVEDEAQFLCPVCDTPVRSEDTVCPGCGAEFSEGQATEYECPVCKKPVPSDADHCPSCGVRFAAEEPPPAAEAAPEPAQAPVAPRAPLTPPPTVAAAKPPEGQRLAVAPRLARIRDEVQNERREIPFGDRKLIARELPRLVTEVKPLLVSAKRIGVHIDEGKRLINNAVEAGKRKEMEKAIRLIADARRSLDIAFVDHIGGQMSALASEVDASGRTEAADIVRFQLDGAIAKLEKQDYDGAWDALQAARGVFQSQAKEFTEGRKILAATERLLADVRSLGMDSKEVDRLIRQSREAGDHRDLPGSLRFARQAQERLLKTVPEFVQKEMREARDRLLEVKVRGGDLSKSVVILKEASAHVKNEEWSEAIRFLKEFDKEISRPAKA